MFFSPRTWESPRHLFNEIILNWWLILIIHNWIFFRPFFFFFFSFFYPLVHLLFFLFCPSGLFVHFNLQFKFIEDKDAHCSSLYMHELSQYRQWVRQTIQTLNFCLLLHFWYYESWVFIFFMFVENSTRYLCSYQISLSHSLSKASTVSQLNNITNKSVKHTTETFWSERTILSFVVPQIQVKPAD